MALAKKKVSATGLPSALGVRTPSSEGMSGFSTLRIKNPDNSVDPTIVQEANTRRNRAIRGKLGLGNEGDTILDDILETRKKKRAAEAAATVAATPRAGNMNYLSTMLG